MEFPKVIEYKITPSPTVPSYIYLLYDAHYFSSQCDVELLEKTIYEISKNKNASVIIGGDFFDAILPTDKRFDFNILPQEALENIHDMKYMMQTLVEKGKELLSSISDKIIVFITGNHEETASKKYFFDIAGYIGEELDFPVLGYHAFIRIKIVYGGKTRRTLRVYTHHGWGGGRLPGAKINNLVKLSQDVDADIYITGHTHDYTVHRKMYLTTAKERNIVKERERIFIKVPSLRIQYSQQSRETTFEEKRGFPLQTRIVPYLKVFWDKKNDVEYIEVIP